MVKTVEKRWAFRVAIAALCIGGVSVILSPFVSSWHELAPVLLWFYVPLLSAVVGVPFAFIARKRWLVICNLLPIVVGFPALWFLGTLLFGP